MANAPSWIYSFGSSAVAAPTLASLNFSQADIAGGGQSLVATGTNCTGVTAVNVWGTTVTPSSTTATTVTFAAPAHAAGVTTASLTGPGGTSGTLAFESWSPVQMTGIGGSYDASKGASASSWADQSATAGAAAQATAANQPTVTASSFGGLPGVTFAAGKGLTLTTRRAQAAGRSVFFVGKWTAVTSAPVAYVGNPPLTVVGDTSGSVAGGVGASAGAVHYSDANVTANSASRGAGYNDGNPRLVGWTHSNATNLATAYLGASTVGATAPIFTYASWGWDSIGNGYNTTSADNFIGTLGAVIVLDQVATGGDITKLNAWSQQRFGTP